METTMLCKLIMLEKKRDLWLGISDFTFTLHMLMWQSAISDNQIKTAVINGHCN